MIDIADEPLDSRIFAYLNTDPVNDGGQFDMAVNIVEKYGIVPQAVFPESYSSSKSAPLNSIVTSKLREFGLELRDIMSNSGLSKDQGAEKARQRKGEMMKIIFNILSCTMGTPPKADAEFTWEAYDKDGKFFKITTTPKKFYAKYSGPHPPGQCFSLINDPRNDFDKLYTVDRLGNVVGGHPIRCRYSLRANTNKPFTYTLIFLIDVNAPAESLEKAVIACIKADQPVFFGCDSGAHGVRKEGIWDAQIYDYKKAYGTSFNMNKAQRLHTGDSVASHAMVLTAVHVDDKGRAVRYKIENSWSDESGKKGWFMCTAEWFNE